MANLRRRHRLIPLVVLVAVFVAGAALRETRSPDRNGKQPAAHHKVFEDTAATLSLQRAQLLTPRLVRLAITKARAYWGGTNCDNGIAFQFRPLPKPRIAEAEWEAFPGPNPRYLNCRVTFDANPTKIKTTFLHFCGAVIHEYGHLSGHRHVADPTKIMNPVLSKRNVPATCTRV